MTDTNALDFYQAKIDDHCDRLANADTAAEIKIRLWLINHYTDEIDCIRQNGERIALKKFAKRYPIAIG